MAFLCPVRIRRGKKKKRKLDEVAVSARPERANERDGEETLGWGRHSSSIDQLSHSVRSPVARDRLCSVRKASRGPLRVQAPITRDFRFFFPRRDRFPRAYTKRFIIINYKSIVASRVHRITSEKCTLSDGYLTS